MKPNIAGIRFEEIGKLYHFDAGPDPEIVIGDFAIVETSRGRQLGQVMVLLDEPPPAKRGKWKKIKRKATPADLLLRQTWQQKELAAMIECRAKAADMKVEGLKIVKASYTFDGTRLTFLYNHDDDDKIDVSKLRKSMQKLYTKTKVEMRHIGPRDVAKIIGGMGACGLESRCCSTFLTEFSPISIKMAKMQGISLDPNEITGMCGRLRCCLIFEYEQYVEARKTLPKIKKRVVTPLGDGKVIDVLPLKDSVIVYIEDQGRKEFHKDEIEPWDELQALKKKAMAPCGIHEAGGCTCGKDRAAKTQTKTNGEDKPKVQAKPTKRKPDQRRRSNKQPSKDKRPPKNNQDKKH